VVERESFGAALQYFTGNKDHNVKVREIAIKKGYKLNEYGLFDRKNRNVAAGENEEEVYETLGMDWMEPEMRENRGEINLALQHKLPKLVELREIRGDLQMHSKNTDGGATIEEMAAAASGLGREYIGMTDHSKSEYVTKGMDDKRFMKYFKEIDEVNKKLKGKITVLKSGEVDLLKDGTLDLKKETLEQMDYVLTAIHTNFTMSKEDMTKRIVKGLESGLINIFGHPTSRVINRREPLAYDIDKVFEVAKENNVIMEIDALPDRLDLNDENCMKAKEYGLKFCIDTDAHLPFHLQFMRYGIGVAKRAWLTKNDVINVLTLEKLLKTFKK
jgi:DNA polymerase (family 10)